MSATEQELIDNSVGDGDLSFKNEIANLLLLDDNEQKEKIVDDVLKNGRQSLINYKNDIIPKIYKEVMDNNDCTLMILLKKNIQKTLETKYGASNAWFISFLSEYDNGENHDVYDRIFTRAVDYGTTYMKDCPILSIVLQLLFEGLDDDSIKKTKVFDDLWFTITNDGLQSITKYSDYIIKSVMNEQLKSQSTLFLALREYYRENVFATLKQSNISDKRNLYGLVLDDIVEHGWLSDMKSIEDEVTPRAYNILLEKLRSFHKTKPSESGKSASSEKGTSSEKMKPSVNIVKNCKCNFYIYIDLSHIMKNNKLLIFSTEIVHRETSKLSC